MTLTPACTGLKRLGLIINRANISGANADMDAAETPESAAKTAATDEMGAARPIISGARVMTRCMAFLRNSVDQNGESFDVLDYVLQSRGYLCPLLESKFEVVHEEISIAGLWRLMMCQGWNIRAVPSLTILWNLLISHS